MRRRAAADVSAHLLSIKPFSRPLAHLSGTDLRVYAAENLSHSDAPLCPEGVRMN